MMSDILSAGHNLTDPLTSANGGWVLTYYSGGRAAVMPSSRSYVAWMSPVGGDGLRVTEYGAHTLRDGVPVWSSPEGNDHAWVSYLHLTDDGQLLLFDEEGTPRFDVTANESVDVPEPEFVPAVEMTAMMTSAAMLVPMPAHAPVSAPVTTDEWRTFLSRYSREVLAGPDQEFETWVESEGTTRWVPRFTPAQHEQQWLGHEPCDETAVSAREAELGCTLPPSYRNFLLVSNGWADGVGPSMDRIASLDEIGWTAALDQWSGFEFDLYGPDIDQRLHGSLQVASGSSGDSWLLDPSRVDSNGEWAALLWSLGTSPEDDPVKYRSFGELVAAQEQKC